MKAGAELDAIMAGFMGWRHSSDPLAIGDAMVGKGGPVYFDVPRVGIGVARKGLPTTWDPSTSIASAWEVVEKMRERGYVSVVTVDCFDDGSPAGVSVEFWTADPPEHCRRKGEAGADTAPLAICIAALRAVGVEVPDEA